MPGLPKHSSRSRQAPRSRQKASSSASTGTRESMPSISKENWIGRPGTNSSPTFRRMSLPARASRSRSRPISTTSSSCTKRRWRTDLRLSLPTSGGVMSESRTAGLLLVAPALLLVSALFAYPLVFSVASAVSDPAGGVGLANFAKAFQLFSGDILYTVFIVAISTALTGLVSIAIAGYLTMGETPWLVSGLAWLYRWPLFIPFVVVAPGIRTFLAKNGMLNNTLVMSGLFDPDQTVSLLDWRGIIVTFVWKRSEERRVGKECRARWSP